MMLVLLRKAYALNRRGIPRLRGAACSQERTRKKSLTTSLGMTGLGGLAEMVAKN
jgi:hypothetical protein